MNTNVYSPPLSSPPISGSVVTLIPSVFLMIFLSPRLLTVVGKGRLEGVKATPVFVVKMLTALVAYAVQLGILSKVISDNDLYGSSSILSSAVYLAGLVRFSFFFHLILLFLKHIHLFTLSSLQLHFLRDALLVFLSVSQLHASNIIVIVFFVFVLFLSFCKAGC